MIFVQLQQNGVLKAHTFYKPVERTFDSPIDVWKKNIHHTDGYVIDEKDEIKRSPNSLHKDAMIELMIQNHKNDCTDAAEEYIRRTGIIIKPTKTDTKKTTGRDTELDITVDEKPPKQKPEK